MQGKTSNDQRIDWALITVLYKLLFVLCFNDNFCSYCIENNVVEQAQEIMQSAMKENKHFIVTSILRFLSFISSDDSVKDRLSQINVLSALFAQLSNEDKDDKKFVLSVLNDLVGKPKAV